MGLAGDKVETEKWSEDREEIGGGEEGEIRKGERERLGMPVGKGEMGWTEVEWEGERRVRRGDRRARGGKGKKGEDGRVDANRAGREEMGRERRESE